MLINLDIEWKTKDVVGRKLSEFKPGDIVINVFYPGHGLKFVFNENGINKVIDSNGQILTEETSYQTRYVLENESDEPTWNYVSIDELSTGDIVYYENKYFLYVGKPLSSFYFRFIDLINNREIILGSNSKVQLAGKLKCSNV